MFSVFLSLYPTVLYQTLSDISSKMYSNGSHKCTATCHAYQYKTEIYHF